MGFPHPPHDRESVVLSKYFGDQEAIGLEGWRKRGGYVALQKALSMLTTEDGKAKCVGCGLCPTVCPANCIKLVPGEDEKGNRYPLVFEIDEFRCIFCGYCQEVCPEEAIHVGRHYENSEYSREGFVYDLERLMAQTHPVCEMWDPADPKGE